YLDSQGNYTQKLMDEVLNFSNNDITNYNQINFGTDPIAATLDTFKSGVYNALKTKNSSTDGINGTPTAVKSATNEINNINAARIESLGGNIFIKTKEFNNIAKDNIDVTANPEDGVLPSSKTQILTGNRAWKSTVLYSYNNPTSQLTSDPSYLVASGAASAYSGNINIEADNLLNRSSIIAATNDINIKAVQLTNDKTTFNTNQTFIYETHWKRCRNGRWNCKEGRYFTSYQNPITLASNTPALISAGNDANIDAISEVLNDSNIKNPVNLNAIHINAASLPSGSLDGENDNLTDNPNATNGTKTIPITLPTTNNGLFKTADPSSEYLIETNSRFLDANILTGSKYFKQRFGFDPNMGSTRFLGDPYYEWKFINDQILNLTKKQRNWTEWMLANSCSPGGGASGCGSTAMGGNLNSWEESLKALIDNAFAVSGDLNLTPGVKLTKAQIAALTKDIIWYETEEIIPNPIYNSI
ncbi:MAG: hypothetical protein RLZZ27_903, partial [Actinomycetota bacterium]